MRPYFQKNGIEIYHGDCHEVLREFHLERDAAAGAWPDFDAMITDPPYCSGAGTLAGKSVDPIEKYSQSKHGHGRPTFSGDAKDQRAFEAWSIFWMALARGLCRPQAYGLVFVDWRQLPSVSSAFQGADWVWRGLMQWDKGLGSRAPHKGYARHQCEYVVWGTNGKCRTRLDAGPFPGVYRVPTRQSDKFHLTGKPTDLMVDLVSMCSPGGRVIDPFAGSGTTLVAAAKTGRTAVGIEREEENCEIAAERLERLFQTGQIESAA